MRDARPAAHPLSRAPVQRAAMRHVGFVALAGALVLSTAVVDAAAGSGTSTTTLRQKAAALASRISADDSELNSLGATYLAARADLSRDQSAQRATSLRVVSTGRAVVSDRSTAAAAAAAYYVDAGAAASIGIYFSANPDQIAIGETYLNFVEGRLSDSVAHLRYDQAALRTALAVESSEAAEARSALSSAEATRTTVLSTLSSQQSLLQQVQGQIAQLVAEQLAAERAAAAKAAALAAEQAAASGVPNGPPAVAVSGITSLPTGTLSKDFAALRDCESGGKYGDDTGNGYYGAYQFSYSTWLGLGESGLPSAAAPAVQDAAAYTLYRHDGWGPWPACAAIEGL